MHLYPPDLRYCATRRLQLVQNAAARILTKMETYRSYRITPILASLHWLPIKPWADLKVVLLTYKALHHLLLAELITPYTLVRPLHPLDAVLLVIPAVKEKKISWSKSICLLCTLSLEWLSVICKRITLSWLIFLNHDFKLTFTPFATVYPRTLAGLIPSNALYVVVLF